jgi:hypothetical protein
LNNIGEVGVKGLLNHHHAGIRSGGSGGTINAQAEPFPAIDPKAATRVQLVLQRGSNHAGYENSNDC